MQDLSKLTETLLDAAKTAGADAADAIATEGVSLSIQTLDGQLEQAERAEGVEIGLRVLIGHRQACVSASDTRPETINEVAERAVAMAKIAPEDPSIGLADASQLTQETDASALDLEDPGDEPLPATLQDAALAAEASALALNGISKVQSSSAGYTKNRMAIAATNGFNAGYNRTSHGVYCVAITGEGTEMERDYYGEAHVYHADLPDPEQVGRIAAERTLARAGARKPPTGSYPVIFDERIAGSLIAHLLQASNGMMIARGSSWLRDRLGEQVLPKGMTLIEEPRRPRVSSSKPFDAEGLPTADRAIVEDGVLMGWTLDLSTARKLGMTSTASASRSTSAPPSPTTGNVRLTQGDQTLEDLCKEVGTGLLVTSMIGSTINPTTGDYSRGASGFWIENGEKAYAVNECTIAGNLNDMLKTLRPANDARTWMSRVVPSLAVESLTIAGN